MPEPAGVRVSGAARLRRELRRAGAGMDDLRAAHARAAELVAARAAASAPRRTGALASTVRGAGAQGRASVRAGYARIPYGPVVHWGWPARNIPANPWISETAQATENVWVPVYRQAVQQLLNSVEGA